MTTTGQLPPSHAQSSFFIGREEDLQSLRETLLAKHVAVLRGERGIGKTALAREYARRFAHEYEYEIWLDMATPESLLTSVLAQGQRFSLPEEVLRKGFAGMSEILETWAHQQGTLLVFDNISFLVQAPLTQEGRSAYGHVLLVVQNEERLPFLPDMEVKPLTAPESAMLVTRAPREQDSNEQRRLALELAREMDCSLLALTLARGYLDMTGCNLQDYLFAYRDCPERSASASSGENEALEIACDLTLAQLEQSHPLALRVLQVCMFLAFCAIPREIFQQNHLRKFLFSEETESPAEQVHEAIQVLLGYKLLETHDETDTLGIHPLLAAVLRPLLPQEQRDLTERLLAACLRLARTYEHAFEQEHEWMELAFLCALAGHIRALANAQKETALLSREAAEACVWAALLSGGLGLVRESEPLLSRALNTWEHVAGSSSTYIADTLFYLAVFNARLQQYPAAEAYGLRAITVTAEALGLGHPSMLDRLNVLADIYQQQGKLKEARVCYEKVLSIGERASLQQHPSYRAARIGLLK